MKKKDKNKMKDDDEEEAGHEIEEQSERDQEGGEK